MARGNTEQTRVVFKGKGETFIVFVESVEDLEAWKKDSSVPLAQVMQSFNVLVSDTQGAAGILDTASHAVLENEFGTAKEEEVVKKILTEGSVQVVASRQREGNTNMSNGSR